MRDSEQPLVSVLVPVYRVEGFIERCARSVFEQTYDNLEFIFVDDATDDSSIDILERVLDEYPKCKTKTLIVHHNHNRGLAAARNTAVSSCKGDFVFHVDSDDWVENNAVELLVKKQQETDADIVSAEAFDHYQSSPPKEHLSGGWNLDKKSLLVGILSYRVSTSIWRRLIRRSLYTNNNIACDERGSVGEDLQVFPKLVYYANKVCGIKEHIYNYSRTNQHSYTNIASHEIEIQKQGLISVKDVTSFFLDKEPFLRSVVAGLEIKYVHYHLLNNAYHKNREEYNVFLNYMKKADSTCLHFVHWNNPIIRCIEENYYSIKILKIVYDFKNKLNRLILGNL